MTVKVLGPGEGCKKQLAANTFSDAGGDFIQCALHYEGHFIHCQYRNEETMVRCLRTYEIVETFAGLLVSRTTAVATRLARARYVPARRQWPLWGPSSIETKPSLTRRTSTTSTSDAYCSGRLVKEGKLPIFLRDGDIERRW